jgi:hypothetical protein
LTDQKLEVNSQYGDTKNSLRGRLPASFKIRVVGDNKNGRHAAPRGEASPNNPPIHLATWSRGDGIVPGRAGYTPYNPQPRVLQGLLCGAGDHGHHHPSPQALHAGKLAPPTTPLLKGTWNSCRADGDAILVTPNTKYVLQGLCGAGDHGNPHPKNGNGW